MANKIFEVIRRDTTVESCYVMAETKEEAEEIAQMDHVAMSDGEIEDSKYSSYRLRDRPKGRIVHTRSGYEDANGVLHEDRDLHEIK